jgi:predicted XRE-type DNA-binding protein
MKVVPDNRGEKHGQSKLTEWDILAIRLDDRQQKVISYHFNICQSRVSEIKNKKAWRHV